jgi:hypothetical protein
MRGHAYRRRPTSVGSTRRVVRRTSCTPRFFQLVQVVAHVGPRHLQLARRLAQVAASMMSTSTVRSEFHGGCDEAMRRFCQKV